MTRPTQLDYLRLRTRSDAALARVVRTYATTDKGAAWFGQEAAKVLVRQHAEAVALGRALAGGSGRVTAADKLKARQIVMGKDGESSFLAGFVRDLRTGRYTEEGLPRVKAIQQRASLYSRKLAGTANAAFVEASGDGFTWVWRLGHAEHCPDCLALAAGSPYRGHELPSVVGQFETQCRQNCHCKILRSDGLAGFSLD